LSFFYKNAVKGAVNIVGVSASVVYIVESALYHGVTMGTDFTQTKVSKYELELDAYDNILGGQWYNNDHPNFIWKVHDTSAAYGTYDKQAPTFDGSVQGLKDIKSAAVLASGTNNVLRSIATYLLNQSSITDSTATNGNINEDANVSNAVTTLDSTDPSTNDANNDGSLTS